MLSVDRFVHRLKVQGVLIVDPPRWRRDNEPEGSDQEDVWLVHLFLDDSGDLLCE